MVLEVCCIIRVSETQALLASEELPLLFICKGLGHTGPVNGDVFRESLLDGVYKLSWECMVIRGSGPGQLQFCQALLKIQTIEHHRGIMAGCKLLPAVIRGNVIGDCLYGDFISSHSCFVGAVFAIWPELPQ
jgi:hypothetical protein